METLSALLALCERNTRWAVDGWDITCEIALKLISLDLTDDKLKLVKVMAVGQQAITSLQWRHNARDGVSNHQPYDCLLNRV